MGVKRSGGCGRGDKKGIFGMDEGEIEHTGGRGHSLKSWGDSGGKEAR